MSSALLQLTALMTMTIDHIGYRLFPGTELLRMIGRLSFPLFVFMLTEGFVYTGSQKNYLKRLALFALLSEVPYKLFTSGPYWRRWRATRYRMSSTSSFSSSQPSGALSSPRISTGSILP